jgi:hypothetical protein
MGATTTQINTYYAKANREGLTSEVADLFADDVPFFAMCQKVSTSSTHPEWQSDSLNASSKTAVVEGASVTYSQPGTRTRVSNYTQIRLRPFSITFSQLKMDVAGIKEQYGREVMKAMKSLALDYEAIFLFSGNTAVGDTATGRACKGIQRAITTNTAKGTGSGGTAKVLITETQVNTILQKIWNEGGDPRALFCGGFSKRVISQKFTAKTGFTWNVNASARMAIANVNKYEGSFGTLDIIPSREHMVRRATVVTPEHLKVFVFRDIAQYEGAQTKTAKNGWVEGELSLGWGNQKAHGRISWIKHSGAIA